MLEFIKNIANKMGINLTRFGIFGRIKRPTQPNNKPPQVDAGTNITVTLPTTSVRLIAVASDTDGNIAAYSWTKISGGSATIVTPSSRATYITNLAAGIYTFQVIVTDNKGATATDTVIVTVIQAANVLPTVSLEQSSYIITLPENEVEITALASDSDGTIASYAWTKIGGPSTYTISNPNNFTTFISDLVEGTYIFRVTVTDNRGGQASTTATVVVNAAPPVNVPPTANAGNDQSVTLPTNSVNLTGSGIDGDGTIVSYAWTKSSGGSATITSPSSMNTSVTGLSQGSYVFTLTVTDNNGATATDSVGIVVNPAPNIAPAVDAGQNQTITLPTNSTSVTAVATDVDGTISSYVWTKVSGPSGGTISSPSSATTNITSLQQGTYIFKVTVTDDDGDTAVDNITITVNPEAIVVNALISDSNGGTPKTALNLTTPASLTLYSVSTGSPTVFQWTKVSGAAITFGSSTSSSTTVNGLLPGTYIFQLQAWNGTVTDTRQITVNVVASIGNIYYIASNGDDNRSKSQASNITTPWKSLDKLSSASLQPGDTVYVRGGIYYTTKSASSSLHWSLSGINGNSSNMINIHAYPGEKPIFSAENIVNPTNSDPTLFKMTSCNYINLKGIRFTTLPQVSNGAGVSRGFVINSCSNNKIEQIELDHIGGYGFIIESGCNSNLFLNCDAHHMGDELSTDGGAWGNANGFQCTGNTTTGTTPSTGNIFEGCRAWWISDDGFDLYGVNGYFEMRNCWSFWNGYKPDTFEAAGDGDGFKLGPDGGGVSGSMLRKVTNCLAFENRQHGFNQNNGNMRYTLYNNIAYKNGHPEAGRPVTGYGFMWDYVSPDPVMDFKNNVSYANQRAYRGNEILGSKNTWSSDFSGTITDSDFVSVSSIGADGPRKADGSLPDLNFLKPSQNSQLINKGVNVGIPYLGIAPDLGPYEIK